MMAPRSVQPLIRLSRQALRRSVQRFPRWRRLLVRTTHEVWDALDDNVYGSSYFGEGRDPLDRMGLSGYERYDRDTSNANAAAYVIWRYLDAENSLDVGCATGFVVEALRELGLDAKGCDVSQYAVDHAALGAAGHLQYADLTAKLPYKSKSFDVVSALETLEHMPPDSITHALSELHRVSRKYLVCTIPSFGPNEFGPGGWLEAKVKEERLDYYKSLGPDYQGPVPFDDLYRDADGNPIEGHLTIASFDWWTAQFENAGWTRCGAVELRIHPHLARFGLTKYWNLYVMRRTEISDPPEGVRTDDEAADVEQRFGLSERTALPEDVESVNEALGRNGLPLMKAANVG